MVEHWTSEAEHFYFRYDLKARTFRATYLLGSEELHSKEDLGLITCRGIGGEPFDLDELQRYDHDQGSPDDRQFLLMSVESEGHTNDLNGHQASYFNTFSCMRKKIVFRPQLTTPRPTIFGPQKAIVVGPPGEEIFTDELGRVKVKCHWDRKGEHNDKSSFRVRVAQSGASGGFGSILIPRVGNEAYKRVRRAASRACDWRWCSFGSYYVLKYG